jgi:hypothetical protein
MCIAGMRHLRLAVLLALAPSVALAATLASTNPALIAEIAARQALLPGSGLTKAEARQKAALGKADEALAHDAADLKTTVADARRAVGALDKAYPDDATFGPLLATLVAGVTAEAQARLDALAAAADALPDGKTKTKVTKKVDKAIAALAAAAGAATRGAALGAVTKAARQIASGEKKLGGGGGPTTTEFDMAIGNPPTDQIHYPATPAGPLDHYTTVADANGPGIFTLSAAADGSAATYAIMFFVLGPGTGDRAM